MLKLEENLYNNQRGRRIQIPKYLIETYKQHEMAHYENRLA